jgi:hypothetical protein
MHRGSRRGIRLDRQLEESTAFGVRLDGNNGAVGPGQMHRERGVEPYIGADVQHGHSRAASLREELELVALEDAERERAGHDGVGRVEMDGCRPDANGLRDDGQKDRVGRPSNGRRPQQPRIDELGEHRHQRILAQR